MAEITEISQFVLRWSLTLVSGSGAVAAPSTSKRQARRMKPRTILQLLYRHKKWTRQLHPPRHIMLRTAHSTHPNPASQSQNSHDKPTFVVTSSQLRSASMDRIAALNDILTQNPNDTFAR